MIGKSLPLMLILGARDTASRVIENASARIRRSYERIGGQGAMARLRNAGDGFRVAGAHVRSLALGIGAVSAAAGSSFYAFRRFANEGDRVAKTAARLGMGVEALQEYEFAAGQAGVSQEQLTSGLVTFNRNLGLARAGTGRLFGLLQRPNVAPDLLTRLIGSPNPESAFREMLSAIGKIEDSSNRLALANAAFGGSGPQFTSFASAGDAEIERLRLRARELGIISAESAKAAEVNSDSWDETLRAFKGSAYELAGTILPELTKAQDRWTDSLVKNRSAATEWGTALKGVVADATKVGDGIAWILAKSMELDSYMREKTGTKNEAGETEGGFGLPLTVLGAWLAKKTGAYKLLAPALKFLGRGAVSLGPRGLLGASGAGIAIGLAADPRVSGPLVEFGTSLGTEVAADLRSGPYRFRQGPSVLQQMDRAIGLPDPEARSWQSWGPPKNAPIELIIRGLPPGVTLEARSDGTMVPVRRGENLPSSTGGL